MTETTPFADKDAEIARLRAMIVSDIENPMMMITHLAPLPVNSMGMRRLLDDALRLRAVVEMVRDADDDCRLDGLAHMPDTARAAIDRALNPEPEEGR